MFKITRVADDRLDIALSGSLDAIEMAAGLDHLIAEAGEISHGKMLYRITDFQLPTLGALIVEMGRIPSMFGLLSSFDKCALLCDTAWIRHAAEVEGAVLPGLEIKAFPLDAEAAALRWLDSREDPLENVAV